jgi:hypothetical protein
MLDSDLLPPELWRKFVIPSKPPPSKESVSLPNGHAWLVGTELPGRP